MVDTLTTVLCLCSHQVLRILAVDEFQVEKVKELEGLEDLQVMPMNFWGVLSWCVLEVSR